MCKRKGKTEKENKKGSLQINVRRRPIETSLPLSSSKPNVGSLKDLISNGDAFSLCVYHFDLFDRLGFRSESEAQECAGRGSGQVVRYSVAPRSWVWILFIGHCFNFTCYEFVCDAETMVSLMKQRQMKVEEDFCRSNVKSIGINQMATSLGD